MMDGKETFLAYLEQEKKQCMEREAKLIAEERKDEANLCKVEANIYDIFSILYQTALKETEKKAGESSQAEELFLQKAEIIPANWKNSYEAAKAHQDTQKILVEETKLGAVQKIMTEYKRLREER